MPGVVRQTRSGTLPSGAKYQVNRFKYPEGGSYTVAHASKNSPGKSHTSVDRSTFTTPGGKTDKGTVVKKTATKLGAKSVRETVTKPNGESFSNSTVSKGRNAKSYASSTNPKGGKTAVSYDATPREKKKAMKAVSNMRLNQSRKGK